MLRSNISNQWGEKKGVVITTNDWNTKTNGQKCTAQKKQELKETISFHRLTQQMFHWRATSTILSILPEYREVPTYVKNSGKRYSSITC